MLWTFRLSFNVDILAILGHCFGNFFQNVGTFFPIFWSPWLKPKKCFYARDHYCHILDNFKIIQFEFFQFKSMTCIFSNH